MTSPNDESRKHYSFKNATKLLVGILTALAVENALRHLALQSGATGYVRPLHMVPAEVWLTFFVSITLTIRFFLGNIEYLNSDPGNDSIELLLDSSTILIQSMILALITNYINEVELFFLYIIGLLVFELFWFILFSIQANIREKMELQRSIAYAQVISIVTIFALFIIGFSYPVSLLDHGLSEFLQNVQLNIGAASFIMIVNLGFDLWLNGRRYLDLGATSSLPILDQLE